MRNHLLFSDQNDGVIYCSEKFNRTELKSAIVTYLNQNPSALVEHCREFNKADQRKFVGYEIINLYECNPKSGKPSLVFQRGEKTYYKSLVD